MKLLKPLLCLLLLGFSAAAQDTHSFCFFFNLSNLSGLDLARAQAGAIEFVQRKVAPSDSVSIIMADSKVTVLQDFTMDRDAMIAAINQIMPYSGLNTVDTSLEMLQEVSKRLQSIPGKKELVYFSGGLHENVDQAQLDTTVATLRQANVSIYAMDTRGLTATTR